MTVTIRTGDCRDVLKTLSAGSVDTCVTSPPYFGLRDYGVANQIGLEPTPEEFIAELVAVFREVKRVLRDDGTLWVNMGDSYSRNPSKGGSGPGGKNSDYSDTYTQASKIRRETRGSSDGKVGRGDRANTRVGGEGIKTKDLIGIPWMLAFALRSDGWYLRQDIIWSKPNPMPESVRDRCTKAHEYVFLLSKSEQYYFDNEAIKEPVAEASKTRLAQNVVDQTGSPRVPGKVNGNMKAVGDGETRNRRSVWTVATRPYKGAHFATFPTELIEPCILAGSRIGGIVLDPFGGAGTTGLVSEKLGRDSILIELNPEYAEMATDRTSQGGLILV